MSNLELFPGGLRSLNRKCRHTVQPSDFARAINYMVIHVFMVLVIYVNNCPFVHGTVFEPRIHREQCRSRDLDGV